MKRRLTRGPIELPDLLGVGVLQELIQVVLRRGLVIVPPVPKENCSWWINLQGGYKEMSSILVNHAIANPIRSDPDFLPIPDLESRIRIRNTDYKIVIYPLNSFDKIQTLKIKII